MLAVSRAITIPDKQSIMKMRQYIKGLLLLAAVSVPSAYLAAQTPVLPESGQWEAQKILTPGDYTVNLTGDVTVGGVIEIGSSDVQGVNITLNNSAGKDVTIHDNSGSGKVFVLHYGNSLTIKGNAGNSIIIDGGANLTWKGGAGVTTWSLECGADAKVSTDAMIETNGTLTLSNVTIRNYYSTTRNRGAILVSNLYKEGTTGEECGETTLGNCLIENCEAMFGAAIICHSRQNKSNTPESCAISLTNTTIRHCVVTADNSGSDPEDITDGNNQWGGVIRFKGGCINNLNMTGCTMEENYSHWDGSCIWWNAGTAGGDGKLPVFTLDGCRFVNNKAGRDAGAIRVEASIQFTGETSVFTGNRCGRHGGAIQLASYNAVGKGTFTADENTYELSGKLVMYDNHAGDPNCSEATLANGSGGAIAFWFTTAQLEEGFKFRINYDGATLYGNSAINGGGISFIVSEKVAQKYDLSAYLNSGQVYDNTVSGHGGGIYADGVDITHEGGNMLTVRNNNAEANGGGIYLRNGAMNLSGVNVFANKAVDGGGICIVNGNFTIENADVTQNESSGRGGGMFVDNNEQRTHEEGDVILHVLAFEGGNISRNKCATAGGGLYLYGHVEATLSGVNIENNEADNAGGIMVKGVKDITNPKVTYEDGMIRYNKATLKEEKIRTAYNTTVEDLHGVGGGILIGAYASMEFKLSDRTNLGIWGNEAFNAADDIFCSSIHASIDLPDVSSMTLTGNEEARGHTLLWVEDYMTNEPNYNKGTNRKSSEDTAPNQRYRDVRDGKVEEGNVYDVPADTYGDVKKDDNRFLCLTLGWSVDNLFLKKRGMKERDNAIFKLYRQSGGGGEPEYYMTVILTKDDADETEEDWRSKTIRVENGTWVIEETPWSWAYTSEASGDGADNTGERPKIRRKLTLTSTEVQRTFRFTNTPKEYTPMHAESVKINKMPQGN
jgi:hypothetical protein